MNKLLQVTDSPIWDTSLTNEVGRLAQGIGKNSPHNQQVKCTNTLFFIHRSQIPKNTKVTYANLLCDIKPHKKEARIVRLAVGGNRLEYYADPSAPAVVILDTTFTSTV